MVIKAEYVLYGLYAAFELKGENQKDRSLKVGQFDREALRQISVYLHVLCFWIFFFF